MKYDIGKESLKDILQRTADEKTTHRNVTKLLEETYYYKNKKYGDSFTDGMNKYGNLGIPIRLNDKLNRIGQICQGSDDNESLIDNLLDLANYAIMSAMYLNDKAREEVQETEPQNQEYDFKFNNPFAPRNPKKDGFFNMTHAEMEELNDIANALMQDDWFNNVYVEEMRKQNEN